MPGLRHAHTLQQLKSVIEYSPPGEYLNNTITSRQFTINYLNIKVKILISDNNEY